VDVFHPGQAVISKDQIKEMIVKKYSVKNAQTVVLFGFQTQYGGGQSSGFCLIYDNLATLKSIEPKFRQVRAGLETRVEKSRKQIKERKNRAKRVRSSEKAKILQKK
jgi:small subunit ribosomal protein S24e